MKESIRVLTSPDHDRTHEVLSDQVDDYAALSSWYAARGDTRRAVLAVWAADVRAMQALLWETGLPASGDPTRELSCVAAAMEAALLGRGAPVELTARGVLEHARQALLAGLDEFRQAQLAGRFVPLDHLDHLPAPSAGTANLAVTAHLDGRGGEQLVGDLLAAANDCRVVAAVMTQGGEDDEARRLRVSADLAGFEAFLVLESAASGDATLATAEMRWDLAGTKLARAHPAPDDDAVRQVPLTPDTTRAVMRSVLVPAEEQALLSLLDLPIPDRR